ncbi:putative Short coiled-coil protein-like protein [Hypsibius exemplaris]|uniref:Short coiled-coil protein-like protein n=1 Tax=Hypsibius exemplaris TaxID=2072580 RepID=A0A1W0WZ45_HYPEX|nr:putative Short coiled-coil protein-like protein [Hypsibius exemplaris]
MDITSPISEQLPSIPLADEDSADEVEDQDDEEDEECSTPEERAGAPDGDGRDIIDDGSKSVDSFSFQNDDTSLDEAEEKARLIAQVLELQNTLDDLSQKVDSVKEENLKLKSENQVLGQYIENLMTASNVFQSTTQNPKKKPGKPRPKPPQ